MYLHFTHLNIYIRVEEKKKKVLIKDLKMTSNK